jgi:hypothetical protein
MSRSWIIALAVLCGACSTPMLRSVDLTQAAVPVLVTYGVGVTEVELKVPPYGGAAGLPEACEGALTVYDAARTVHAERLVPYFRAADRATDGLTVLDRAGARLLTALEKRTFLAEAKTVLTLGEALRAAEVTADRAKSRVWERCPDEPVRLEALAYVRPSSELLFGLELHGGTMSNDTLKVETGPNGMLTSVTASANDQSGAALLSVATLIGRLMGGPDEPAFIPPPPPPGDAGGSLTRPMTAAERCRLSALPASTRLAEMEKRLVCVDLSGLKTLFEDILFRPSRYYDMRPEIPPPPVRYSIAQLKAGVEYEGMSLRVECVEPVAINLAVRSNGIVVAAPTPCQLVASDFEDDDRTHRFSFIGMSEDYLVVVPVERADLVNNTTTLNFQNGMITTVDASRPSVGAAAIGLPGQLINSFVSGFTSAFTDSAKIENARVAQMTAETERLNAEAARIVAPPPPPPAWSAGATEYIATEGVVTLRRAEYEAALAGNDRSKDAPAAVALQNAKAAANAAAQTAGRPLPYPDLL